MPSFGKSRQKQSASSRANLLLDRKSMWLPKRKSTFVRKPLFTSPSRHAAAV
jgi:hypothetical protein